MVVPIINNHHPFRNAPVSKLVVERCFRRFATGFSSLAGAYIFAILLLAISARSIALARKWRFIRHLEITPRRRFIHGVGGLAGWILVVIGFLESWPLLLASFVLTGIASLILVNRATWMIFFAIQPVLDVITVIITIMVMLNASALSTAIGPLGM